MIEVRIKINIIMAIVMVNKNMETSIHKINMIIRKYNKIIKVLGKEINKIYHILAMLQIINIKIEIN